MINFDSVDFSGRRPEEVISFFWSSVYFDIIRKSNFRRRELYQYHKILLSNFDSLQTSWNTVIFKFRWIFATDERRIVSGQTFHTLKMLGKLCWVTVG